MLTYLSLNRQILIKCTEKRGNDMVGTVGNRRTIYSKKVIRRAFQELLEEIEGELVEQIASNLQQENLSLDLWLEKLLTILYETPSTTHLILLNNSHLLNLLLSEIKPETLKRFAQYFQDASEEELELCLSFFVCGSIGLIERWLKDFSTMPPKAVAELLIQIFVTNVYEDKKG